MSSQTLTRGLWRASTSSATTRGVHTSARRQAVTPFTMPAMSPTMTEGGISSWKKKEGEAFSTGDIILEIETDKATMDVEAQDDGIMGKIVLPEGSKGVPVGKIIAMLAEEGDDISNIQVPSDAPSSSSSPPKKEEKPAPTPQSPNTSSSSPPSSASSTESPAPPHSSGESVKELNGRPLFPSVIRLLHEAGIHSESDIKKIKGTGIRGMIRKGDVLAHLGKVGSPWGTSNKLELEADTPKSKPAVAAKEEKKVLDAAAIRSLILAGLTKSTKPSQAPTPSATFDDIVSPYLPPSSALKSAPLIPPPVTPKSSSYLDGLI